MRLDHSISLAAELTKQDGLSFANNLAHDLCCGLSLVNKGNTLASPERQRIYIPLGISAGRVRSIAHYRPA